MTTAARARLLSIVRPGFRVSRGSPLPFGATPVREGINFALFAKHATSVTLVLFASQDPEPALELPLDPRKHRTGDVWHAILENVSPGVEYGYRVDREPNMRPEVHRFDPSRVLLDPWSKSVVGTEGLRSRVTDDGFDWQYDQPLNIPLADTVIYELHVRGYTNHPSSGVVRLGTYLGLTERIPYLQSLGVTAVELLPVHEFDPNDVDFTNPETGERLVNFWGYQPLAFFAPNSGYALGEPVREFKEMVKRFHEAGIEVILDVVFNHTGEGAADKPPITFRGIDNLVYYMQDPRTGQYLDYTGCSNTLNCNHPVVREMIRNCLRYWVMEMHVDGFRFDLAAVLGRGQDGSVLSNPPLLEDLAHDPVLGETKLIAEAWDAAGLYQVGRFPAWSRWAEWNGKFRDDIRRFVRGDVGMVLSLASRLCGSPDLYAASAREPYHSINFITCHDGFTLADLVSYDHKHNYANGEDNRDGANDNLSWNHGVEGPTSDPEINALRRRQMKNFLTLLLLSQGVPMLLAGDEFGRTQRGNNNAYSQDNDISWVDWRLAETNRDLLEFVRALLRFRREHPILRRRTFDGHEIRIEWHGIKLGQPDWTWDSRSLAMHIRGDGDNIYIIANAWTGDLQFELPPDYRWVRVFDTSRDRLTRAKAGGRYQVKARSVVVLQAS